MRLSHYYSPAFDEHKAAAHRDYYLRYLARIGVSAALPTLDAGCGWGFMSRYYSSTYLGTDISEAKIDFAKSHYGAELFAIDSLVDHNPAHDRAFAQITAFTVIDEIENKIAAIANARRYLSDDGLFFVEVRNGNFVLHRLARALGVDRIRNRILASRHKAVFDLSVEEYTALFEQCGFCVVNIYKAKRPLFSSSIPQLAKKIAYLCIDAFVPVAGCFMLGFRLETAKAPQVVSTRSAGS